MIRTIIIEDEENVKRSLERKLEEYCPEISLVGWSKGIRDSLELIESAGPQLVFLDIKLEDGDGFELLRKLKHITFRIIFITAYNDYALEAFRYSAIDYIMKPATAESLKKAVSKATESIEKDNIKTKLDVLYHNLENLKKKEKRIVLNTADSVHVLEAKDIIRCEADDNYTRVFCCDETQFLISKTLKEFDDMLTPLGFFRSHKSHLINLEYLKSIEKTDGGYLKLRNGSTIPITNQKKQDVIKALKEI